MNKTKLRNIVIAISCLYSWYFYSVLHYQEKWSYKTYQFNILVSVACFIDYLKSIIFNCIIHYQMYYDI